MDYCPNSAEDTRQMLQSMGAGSIEDLFAPIPKSLRAKSFNIPKGLSEHTVLKELRSLSDKNDTRSTCFLGAGIYDHIIPSVVNHLSGRAEFYTAYTPYQPEASQGTLQALFEYQTAICAITSMDVTNASLYDGATALAEAVLMSLRITERNRILIDNGVNPFYREVIKTYLENHNVELIEIDRTNGDINWKSFAEKLSETTACVVFQNPDFFGNLYDLTEIAESIHQAGALFIQSVYPISLGLSKTPAENGADIVTGDGQCLGNPMNFGGPSLGFIAVKKAYIRNLPGRIVGETIDQNGKRAFVLTLQAREQHIKRQKATSNICSNQSLCALRAVIFLSAIGKIGFQELASLNFDKSEFAKSELSKIKGVKIMNTRPTFNEFVIELPKDANIVAADMLKKGFLAGLPLPKFYPDATRLLLVTVTEKRTRDEILAYKKALEASLWQ